MAEWGNCDEGVEAASASAAARQDAVAESPSLPSVLRHLQCNIETAVARDSVCQVAAKTGLDLRRVLKIIVGATPDGYELRLLETAYRTALWPRFVPTDSTDSR